MSHPQYKVTAAYQPKKPTQRLGTNVRALRRRQGLTKALLCLMAGISRPLLDDIEKGKANPTLATLEKIAGALGVTVSDLLG